MSVVFPSHNRLDRHPKKKSIVHLCLAAAVLLLFRLVSFLFCITHHFCLFPINIFGWSNRLRKQLKIDKFVMSKSD